MGKVINSACIHWKGERVYTVGVIGKDLPLKPKQGQVRDKALNDLYTDPSKFEKMEAFRGMSRRDIGHILANGEVWWVKTIWR